MDSNFLNSTLTGLEDLPNLPDKISSLQAQLVQIKTTADSKLEADSPSPADAATVGIDTDKLNESVDKIVDVVRYSLEAESVQESLANVDGLILEFGSLPIFTTLRSLLQDKLEKARSLEALSAAKELHDKLQAETATKTLVEHALAIQELGQNASLVPGAVQILTQTLQDKIDANRKRLEPELVRAVEESRWFSNDSVNIPKNAKQLESYFTQLIELQAINNTPVYPDSWWALDILLNPIITRFNYHFNTPNKETNKISKPEWAFNYIEKFLNENLSILSLLIGDVFKSINRIGEYEVITALLVPLRTRTLSSIKILNDNVEQYQETPENLLLKPEPSGRTSASYEKSGRLLSHLIFELASFDQRIRKTYQYNPYIEDFQVVPSRKWTGVTGDVFIRGDDEHSAVKNWLNFERDLANKRYQSEIIGGKGAFEIDFDYQLDNSAESTSETSNVLLKPTYSAYGLVKLFDNLTSHFQTLSIVKYQLKYVSTVQLVLIDNYCTHLNQLFKRFSETYGKNKVLGLIPGGLAHSNSSETHLSTESTTSTGLKSVQALTEIYCSAKFVQNSLQQWSLELIFVQLWNTFKTFSAKFHTEDSTILDASIKQYDQLTNKVLSKYEEFFKREIRASLKSYVNSSKWDLDSSHATQDLDASHDLLPLTASIPVYLDYLRKSLSQLDYNLITDRIVSLISSILFEYIITNNRFTRAGIAQLIVDIKHVVAQFSRDLYLSFEDPTGFSNDSNTDFLKLNQSVKFLNSVDENAVAAYKKNFDVGSLKKKLVIDVSALSDNDINDLVLRII